MSSKTSLFDIPMHTPLVYHMTGKFEAPDDHWQHQDFDLTDFELIIMTEGVLYMGYRNQHYEVHSDEYLLLPPAEAPDNRRIGYKPAYCSFYWLHFMPTQPFFTRTMNSEDIASALQLHSTISAENILIPIQGKVPNRDKMVFLMKQLQNDVRTDYCSLTLGYETSSILCQLGDQVARESSTRNSPDSQKQIFSDIIDFIRLNNNVYLTVADVAAKFGYNEGYLSHTFTRYTGMTLKQYILKLKMDEANRLLYDTNLSITEVAQAIGYRDVHNFSRFYKKYTGITPSDYRKTYAKRLLYHV